MFRDKFDGSSAFCKTCPTGQFMPYEGGTECSTCPQGRYTSTCQGQSDSGKIDNKKNKNNKKNKKIEFFQYINTYTYIYYRGC